MLISFFSPTDHFCLGQSFRKHLLEELEQNFPNEIETYRESRAAAAAVSNISLVLSFMYNRISKRPSNFFYTKCCIKN